MDYTATFKGLKEIRYPSEDMILRFGSKSRAGEIRLEEETGKFKFDPALPETDVSDKVDKAGDTMTGALTIKQPTGASCLFISTDLPASELNVIYTDDNAEHIAEVGTDSSLGFRIKVGGDSGENGILSFPGYNSTTGGNSLMFDSIDLADAALKSSANTFSDFNIFEKKVVIDEGLIVVNTGLGATEAAIQITANSGALSPYDRLPSIKFYDIARLDSNTLIHDPRPTTVGGITYIDTENQYFIRADKLVSGTGIDINKNHNTGETIISTEVNVSDKVDKAGDTMTGPLIALGAFTPIEIINTNQSDYNPALTIASNSGSLGNFANFFVGEQAFTPFLQIDVRPDDLNTTGSLFISDVFKYNNNIIWHAGNDGEGSGLDADTVRGVPIIDTGAGNEVLTDDGTYKTLVGAGDMLQSVYDTNASGVVDNAELVNGLSVLTAVPAGALFTDNDTTYSVGDGGLTEINFTNALSLKLNGLEQADWTSTGGGSEIKNKPDLTDPTTNDVNADMVDNYHVVVTDVLPTGADNNTIYFIAI